MVGIQNTAAKMNENEFVQRRPSVFAAEEDNLHKSDQTNFNQFLLVRCQMQNDTNNLPI